MISSKDYENKKIDTSGTQVGPASSAVLEEHFFPKYQITIRASSKADALAKLEEHIKSLEDKK